MREDLQELKLHIYEDGTISDAEVTLLKNVFARHGLGEDEAGLLLDLNTVLSGVDHAASFNALLLDSLVAYMTAPGDIAAKLSWLETRLMKDGTVDELERQLLAALATAGISLTDELGKFL